MGNRKLVKSVLAKSDGTTLWEHINDDLVIFEQLKGSLPIVQDIAELNNFWDLLFCAVYFHDFGKIHSEFQKELKKENNYWQGQRHEVYSVPFVYKLDIKEYERDLIARAILAHHKSFKELKQSLISKEDLKFEYEIRWKDKLKYHPKDFLKNLKNNFSKEILQEYFKLFDETKRTFKTAFKLKESIKIDTLKNPIEKYCDFSCDFLSKEYFRNLLLWAGLKISDHLGSAKIKQLFRLEKRHFNYIVNFKNSFTLYLHQELSFNIDESAILIAPTGSGKTESALGWLKNVIEKRQGRTFYILPYTASINAMHKRLVEYIDKNNNGLSDVVGLLHGNLSHYISEYFIEGGSKEENIKRNKNIKKLVRQYKTLISPIIVATPFQLLKYFFGIKGFEKGLFFLSGAKLIFDEIHAYDVQTFAQIVVMLELLKKYFLNDIFIMTATLPTFMIDILKRHLGIKKLIHADKKLLSNLKRHKIILEEGDIINFLEKTFDKIFINDKKYIFVCNTVSRAQEVYNKLLSKGIYKEKMVLLHGRFTQRDRNKKEKKILNNKVGFLIGTQTIEVSLDIDYDVMITEPAPLDALVQRFGRVNRKAKKGISPIHICKKGGKYDKFIYPMDKINKTISVFEDVNDIDENKIQELLDEVYSCWDEKEQKLFEETITLFRESLKSLMPYSFSKDGEEKFYSKFTDIKVLPIVFYRDYKNKIENFDFIEAEKLLVNINRNLFYKYLGDGLISKEEIIVDIGGNIIKNYVYVIRLKYSEDLGLTDEQEIFVITSEIW